MLSQKKKHTLNIKTQVESKRVEKKYTVHTQNIKLAGQAHIIRQSRLQKKENYQKKK